MVISPFILFLFIFNLGTTVNQFRLLLSLLLPALHTNYKRTSQNEVDRTGCLTPRRASGHSNIFCCQLWWYHGSICTKSAPSCIVHYLKPWGKEDQPFLSRTREFRYQYTNELQATLFLNHRVPTTRGAFTYAALPTKEQFYTCFKELENMVYSTELTKEY